MEPREIITLVLGLGVLLYLLFLERDEVRNLPSPRFLLGAFFCLFAAWVLTVAEDIFPVSFLHIVEHLLIAVSTVLLAFWFVKVGVMSGRDRL